VLAWKREPMTFGTEPDRIRRDTEAWRAESNPMFAWATEMLTTDPKSHIWSTELVTVLTGHLNASGHPRWSDQTVLARFAECADALGWRTEKRFLDRERSRAGGEISRPPQVWMNPPGLHYKAWLGVRYKTDNEKRAETEAQASDLGVIGVIGSPAKFSNAPAYGKLTGTPITPITDHGNGRRHDFGELWRMAEKSDPDTWPADVREAADRSVRGDD
jgi:hypothetical protein